MADKDTTKPDDADQGGIGAKITEKLGWLTADRQMEAEGRLKQADGAGLTGKADADDEQAAAEAADRAELEVRRDYDELHPDAEPE